MQADYQNSLLRRVDLSSSLVTTLAGRISGSVGSNNHGYGDGIGTAAAFYYPQGVAMNFAGTFAIVVSVT